MTRLLSSLSLILIAVIISSSLGAPTKESKIVVAIGEPHEVPVPINAKMSGPIDEPLPSWMVKDGAILKMIAPPDALPSNTILIGDLTMEVVVKENEPTGCDSDEWAEAIVTGSPMDQWEIIKSLEQSVLISMSKIRVLPRSYSKAYRHITSTEDGWDKGEGDTVILVTAEQCGTTVVQIVERLAEEGIEALSISKGSIPSRSSRNEDPNSIFKGLGESSTDEPIGEELEMIKETTTLASTTTTRHTRSPSAVAYVPIKAIHCNQGAFCVSELEEKTFLGSNGGVGSFDLTIEHLSGNGGVEPWVIKNGKKRSIGVIGLKGGEHTFRLRGVDRTSKEKVVSPFSITVAHDEPKNHQFMLSMYSLPSEPEHIHTTLVKLTSYLKRNIDEIKVANVSHVENDKWITFWNTSLPTTSCPTKEIAQWLRGLHHKNGAELNQDITKAFAHKPQAIHPSRLEVQWIGNCESEGAAAEKEVKMAGGMSGGRDEKGGEQPKVEETEGSLSTLITVVCILLLLLALLILIICCVTSKRNKAQKGVINEYMTKGTPVVFPDEVDEEHEDVPASAPMLVKEERPPLRVSEHSNPLYKPPPPLASTAASPRPSAPSAHKLPPPYVPP